MSKNGSSIQPKNRGAAAIQITAEQLLREAKERGLEEVERAPTQFITDKEELLQYQAAKRKDFEDQLRRNRQHFGIWCRYALWEASLSEFERSRSVFERAIDVDYRQQMIWVKYAEMEMKHKFVNHARNIWDRCVTLHPRVDTFWYKYTYMEELVGAAEAARQVFERWMQWEPDDLAWGAYIQFEMRQVRSRARHPSLTPFFPPLPHLPPLPPLPPLLPLPRLVPLPSLSPLSPPPPPLALASDARPTPPPY